MKNIESNKERREHTRKESLSIHNIDEIKEQHGTGSLSMNQTHHLSFVLYELYVDSILEDPCILLNKKLYNKAHKICKKMLNLYQEIGNYTDYNDKIRNKEVLDKFCNWLQDHPQSISVLYRTYTDELIKEYLADDK